MSYKINKIVIIIEVLNIIPHIIKNIILFKDIHPI